jgi:3D (Asp-Asp-Asp) domain-containing protein
MKLVFGGGAAIAGTLLASSFLIFVPTSVAEPLHQEIRQKIQTGELRRQNPSNEEPSLVQLREKETLSSVDKPSTGAEVVKAVPAPTGSVAIGPNPFASPATVKAVESEFAPVTFSATAYSLYGRTASGVHVRKGIIAADRRVLPIGTKVRLESGSYSGEYEVCDTGGAIRGKRIDVWVPSSREAMRFGRRPVKLTVLSYPKKAARARQATSK